MRARGACASRRGLDIPVGLSEFDTAAEMERLAAANRGADLFCFAGGGAYDHDVPSAVRRLAGRTEFVTAYTPYQPEVAQGVLQALFEYQTMVARLSGLEIANASLYDGATALGGGGQPRRCRHRDGKACGCPTACTASGRQVVHTFAAGTGHEILNVSLRDGITGWPSPSSGRQLGAEAVAPGAVVVQYPNRLGVLDDMAAAAKVAQETGAMLVVAFDPVAAAVLKSPGEWGADVAVGEGQPFGTPMAFGGPYLGLFAAKLEHVRRIPGRLVGETVDPEGRRAFTTTLRTREQDIRREKASSNVCTNQTLIAVTAMIQMGWLGKAGLVDVATQCARGTRYAREALLGIDGVTPLVDAPVLREFAVATPVAPTTLVERHGRRGLPRRHADRRRKRRRGPTGRGHREADQGPRSTRSSPCMSGKQCRREARSGGQRLERAVVGREIEPTIFELSVDGRRAGPLRTHRHARPGRSMSWCQLSTAGDVAAALPEISERDLVAHTTRLTHRQYSVDLGAYPLGSLHHEVQPEAVRRGRGACAASARCTRPRRRRTRRVGSRCSARSANRSAPITGMSAITLAPPAGASGELTGSAADAGVPRRRRGASAPRSSSRTRRTAPTRRRSRSAATRPSRCPPTRVAVSTSPRCGSVSTTTWPGSC